MDEEKKFASDDETESEEEVSIYETPKLNPPFQFVDPDYDYNEVQEYIRQSLTCGICRGLVEKPLCCRNCASLYCEECIDQLDQYFERLNENHEEPVQSTCPYCRSLPSFEKNVYVNKILGHVYTICYNCNEKIKNSDFSHHLDICVGKITNCILCGTTNKRERVHNCTHVQCHHCQTPVLKDALHPHLEICPEVMIPCEVCKHLYKRGSILEHQRTWCPEYILNCEYCNINVIRRSYNSHVLSCPLAREECNICEESYPRNGMHLCPCTICQHCNTIVQKVKYNEHITKHCLSVNVICPECNTLLKKYELAEHTCITDEDLDNMVNNLLEK